MLTLAVSYDQEEKVEGKEKHKTKKETHCCASRSDVFHLTPSFFYRLMFHSFQSKRANQHGAKEITVTCKEKKKLGLGWVGSLFYCCGSDIWKKSIPCCCHSHLVIKRKCRNLKKSQILIHAHYLYSVYLCIHFQFFTCLFR